MVQRRRILTALTRARLVDLAGFLEIAGLAGKSKDAIVSAIVSARAVKTADLLATLSRADLKTICRSLGLDEGGRDKKSLIARLTGNNGAPRAQAQDGSQAKATDKKEQRSMAKKQDNGKRRIEQYDHKDKSRPNNPPVGLVTPATDPDAPKKTYQYDPHLDPQLVWAGKAEHLSFDVPTVSLHVHERIDPRTIIRAVQKRNGDSSASAAGRMVQQSLFEEPEENPPLREAVEFYKHAQGWTNRLIAGDSLVVMNSLLEKEGMAGKVQMVYIDPPYGIKYGSNFQPFVNKRDVKDGTDGDLTQEPEMVRAFRDTWELEIHSYLTYLRDRLLTARELLHESGSCFVQIGDENLHHVREVLEEVFGSQNFVSLITFKKTGGQSSNELPGVVDYLLWYCRDRSQIKYRRLFFKKSPGEVGATQYTWVELPNGERRPMTKQEMEGEILHGTRIFQPYPLVSIGASAGDRPYTWQGKIYRPSPSRHWSSPEGLPALDRARRLMAIGDTLRMVNYLDDYPVTPVTNIWTDTQTSGFTQDRVYVVQTLPRVIARCILMTSDPGDLVFDPTCGSGTTAFVAENWGRRWITCDTSRVAVTLAKQRLMTAAFDYYELAKPNEGIGSGFVYKTVPHVTLKSIANNPEIHEGMTRVEIDAAIAKYADQETLYDQPLVDRSKIRVTGPFTLEAVPAPAVRPITELMTESRDVDLDPQPTLPGIGPLDAQNKLPFSEDVSVARYGETLRQRQWRDELQACGIRGKAGQRIEFARLEPMGGTRWVQCEGETKGEHPERVVVSFGSENAPLEQRQVAMALDEAQELRPAPTMIIFATFQFDPEAAKDIDETKWPGVTLLKVQMNTDLLTDDLKKNRSSNESYWLMGQPDVSLRKIHRGEQAGNWEVEVHGFDYYNPRTGAIESGETAKIAMWMLDTDYDGRSLFARQVFFPMAGAKDGWARLAKNLKAEIDEELIESYRGTVSLPFEPGDYKRAAVKIVDDRGIESLKIVEIG